MKLPERVIVDGIPWDNTSRWPTSPAPKNPPPVCGPSSNYDIKAYDPLQDCNVTNKIYDLSLSFAIARGEKLPTAQDTARALKHFPPERN